MIYFPALCGNETSKNLLKKQAFSDNITPFFEMVSDVAPRENPKGLYKYWTDIFDEYSSKIVLDVPMDLQSELDNMKAPHNEFFQKVYTDSNYRIEFLNEFDISSKVIPTLSHNPDKHYNKEIINQYYDLSDNFSCKAIRLFENSPKDAFDDASSILEPFDILFIDVNETSIEDSSTALNEALRVKSETDCYIVIKQSTLKSGFKNTELPDKEITPDTLTYKHINHDLHTKFKQLGFDGFSNYPSTRKFSLKNIPIVSPGFLMFDLTDGSYHGFKGVYGKLDSYLTILNNYERSNHWTNIKTSHRKLCDGCKDLDILIDTKEKYKSAVKWKSISMKHYIASIDEFL